MSTIGDALDREWQHIRTHLHHPHYDQTSPKEAPVMTLPIIQAIENDLSAAGHAIDQGVHEVLSRHLTVGNMLGHVSQFAVAAEASPLLQAVERLALGPAAEAVVAKVVEDVAGLLQAQAQPAPAG